MHSLSEEYKELCWASIFEWIEYFNLACIKHETKKIEESKEFFRSDLCHDMMDLFTDQYDAEKCISYLERNADYNDLEKY